MRIDPIHQKWLSDAAARIAQARLCSPAAEAAAQSAYDELAADVARVMAEEDRDGPGGFKPTTDRAH